MKRVSRAALCAVASLSACGTMDEPKVAPGSCSAGICAVEILVTSCTAPGGMSANPNELPVRAPNNIQWTINDPSYRFAGSGGIVFTDPQFSGGHTTGSDKKFILHDDFASLGTFKYTVHLVDGSGRTCLPLDPFVNNK